MVATEKLPATDSGSSDDAVSIAVERSSQQTSLSLTYVVPGGVGTAEPTIRSYSLHSGLEASGEYGPQLSGTDGTIVLPDTAAVMVNSTTRIDWLTKPGADGGRELVLAITPKSRPRIVLSGSHTFDDASFTTIITPLEAEALFHHLRFISTGNSG